MYRHLDSRPCIVLYITFLILLGCTGNNTKDNNVIDLRSLVKEWNSAHNDANLESFVTLYSDSVEFYHQNLPKNKCIQRKLDLLEKYPGYYQQIYGDIGTQQLDHNAWKCSFVKRVTVNGKSTDYPSYLVFKPDSGKWVIAIEGDLITDKNIAKQTEAQNGNNAKTPMEKIRIPGDAVEGDFNGDGKNEFMWLVKPRFRKSGEEGFGECDGECECIMVFSDKNIKSIVIQSCIGGTPVNEGDLDENGSDEIGILPNWWTSCWRAYLVYTYSNNEWEDFVDPIMTHCEFWEKGIEAIEKSKVHKNYVIVRSMPMDADFKIKEELIKVR